MVNEKQTKRERNIRSKLMAAVAMLLVSSIMMVSTTYAWFTLSTAPEVTGITTAVGANGNLEMALVPAVKDTDGVDPIYYTSVAEAVGAIHTGSADSFTATQSKTTTNITWGNLVDLDDTAYGMDKIVLYPSQLNVSEGATTLTPGALLGIPVYGSDGRVSGTTNIGQNGTYDGEGFYENTGYGIRAVGKASGMTAREMAFRSAKANADSAASRANTAASTSLNIGGNALASLAMKHALKTTGDVYTAEDVKGLSDTYAHLLGTTGAITEIETALRQYIIAYVAANSTDDNFATAIEGLESASWDTIKGLAPSEIGTVIDALVTLKNKVVNAQTGADALVEKGTGITWNEVYAVVSILGDTDEMELNGHPISYYMEKDQSGAFLHIQELIDNMNNLKLVVMSGIYVEMSDFCGKISATVKMEGLEYQGMKVSVSPTMEAMPNQNPSYLTVAKLAVGDFQTPDGATSAKPPISDYYGYIVDLAFRTNAAESNLQLQTDAVDRIYSENTANPETMGAGSTMSFSYKTGTGYNGDNIKSLMEGIRVVFFSPIDNSIVGYAKLDVTNVAQSEEVEGTGETAITTYTLTASIKLTDGNGGDFLVNNTLMPLTQNVATALSALVYLDGNVIGNEDVSTTNIVGSMNLQFSSSATLKPMEYSDLRNGSGNTVTEPAATESTGN